MAGKAKEIIDILISKRSKGNPEIAKALRAKLLLKGINPDNYTDSTPDNAAMLAKLQSLTCGLRELNLAYDRQNHMKRLPPEKIQTLQIWVSKQISRTKLEIDSSEKFLIKFEESKPQEPQGMLGFLKRSEYQELLEIWMRERKKLHDERKRQGENLANLMDFREMVGQLVTLAGKVAVSS